MWKQSILEDSSVKEEKVKVNTEATKKVKEDATVTKEKKTTKRKKKVDDWRWFETENGWCYKQVKKCNIRHIEK